MNLKLWKKQTQVVNLEIEDFVNIEFIQQLQDKFAEAVGVGSVTVDLDGTPVTEPSGFTEFCKYVRLSEKGLKGCMECDRKAGLRSAKTGKPNVYECHAGLCDFAVPIIVEDQQIGTMLGGQILATEPEEKKFRRIAFELGLNPDKLIEKVKKIHILDKDTIEFAAEILFIVASNMSKRWYEQYKLKEMITIFSHNLSQIILAMNQISDSAMGENEDANLLYEEIENVKFLSMEINQIIKFIEEIAEKTSLAGLNAAIDDACTKEVGSEFTAVVEQMRKLSKTSKKKAVDIKSLISKIQNSVNKIMQLEEKTLAEETGEFVTIQEITDGIEEINNLSNQLLVLANKD